MAKNFVSNKDETVRMFQNNFLENLSRIHFSVPLFIFLPAVGYLMFQAIAVYHLPALTIAAFFVLGLFVWTFMEYILHRFLFHWKPPGKIGERLHFVFHGVHHDYPSDSKVRSMLVLFSADLLSATCFMI
jgi:sterol desaturase/sphingolipid hydroxylase (fatty acid hydroxylase superfamily)